MKIHLYLILSFLVFTTSISAQSIVKDVNLSGVGSNVWNVLVIGNKMYFTSNDGIHGTEPWVSDGTEAGTQLIKDFEPGETSISMSNFFNLNGIAVFIRVDYSIPTNPTFELWKTDGTSTGTTKMIDLPFLSFTYMPETGLFNQLLLRTTNPDYTYSLWRTDGTTAGTYSIGTNFNNFSNRTSFYKNRFYFTENNYNPTMTRLWTTDGTIAGTKVIDTLITGRTMTVESFVGLGDKVYFGGNGGGAKIWESDGTIEGTKVMIDINPSPNAQQIQYLTAVGEALYFWANDGLSGTEIWKSDGTAAGTSLVKDLTPGFGSSLLNTYGAKGIAFKDTYATLSWEGVWVSDGTENGTKKIAPNLLRVNSYWYSATTPSTGEALENQLFFSRADTTNGTELWISDGTVTGTRLFKDIYREKHLSSSPDQFVRMGNTLYFTATDYVGGRELWRTDGTEGGTVRVKNINPKNGRGVVGIPFKAGNNIFFSGIEPSSGVELYLTDGTASGTQLVKDIGPTTYSGAFLSSNNFAVLDNVSVFAANNLTNGIELWRSDGTDVGTFMLKNINTIPSQGGIDYSSNPSGFTKIGNAIYLRAEDTFGITSLWRTDGTSAGTAKVFSLRNIDGTISPLIREFKGKLAFLTFTNSGTLLWQSDGTETGTGPISNAVFVDNNALDPIYPMDSILFFSGKTDPNYMIRGELWRTDGTKAGTRLVKKIADGTTGSIPRQFFRFGNYTYFLANVSTGVTQLWRSNGTDTGTTKVFALSTQSIFTIESPVILPNKFFFVAVDNSYKYNLWVSDGTEAGTMRVAEDIRSTFIKVLNGKVYFTGFSVDKGIELWETDGTVTGTKMTADVNIGAASSNATPLLVDGTTLYFAASDHTTDFELWRYDVRTKVFEPLKTDNNITAYPNPVRDKVHFRFEDANANFQQIQVFDVIGHLIVQKNLTDPTTSLTLDVHDWAQGTYFVRFISKEKQTIKRIVKTE